MQSFKHSSNQSKNIAEFSKMVIVQIIYVYINFLNPNKHTEIPQRDLLCFFQDFLHVNTIYFITHIAWVMIPWKYSKYRELSAYSEAEQSFVRVNKNDEVFWKKIMCIFFPFQEH